MAQGEGGERTEKATPKRRSDERKKGNVFQSRDVTTILTLVAGFFIIRVFVGSFLERLQELYRRQVYRINDIPQLDTTVVMALFRELATLAATTLLPALFLIGLLAVLTVGFQTRWIWSTEQLKFKWERINPIKGFQRLLSLRSLVELTKSIIKIVVIIWLLYGKVMGTLEFLPLMMDWDLMQAARFVGKEIIGLILTVGVAFGAVAAIDYLYQWWEYEKSIKMTKQEIKDEYKQMEGDPQIKSRRRQKQREYAMARMMQAVKEADVVVRNPTHFAVALKYDLERDMAPIVLAKGQDHIALRIVAEAEAHSVPTVENKTLARSLYELTQIDEMIPPELFAPVAELLAWLFSQRQKGMIPAASASSHSHTIHSPIEG
ncbi:MAG: flagellar biosynthesis protein FlhB [Oscillospiraceae bacterium]|jgi:flagellar biosynthetic protein FlhB